MTATKSTTAGARTQHTSGPWIFPEQTNPRSKRPAWEYIRAQSNGEDICRLYQHSDNSEANARLIAAAPELLEACKLMLDYSRYQEANSETAWSKCIGCDREEGHDKDCPTWTLRAAIAKAEGK